MARRRAEKTLSDQTCAYLAALVRLDAQPNAQEYAVLLACARHVGEDVWNAEWVHAERCPVLRKVYRMAFQKETTWWVL